MIIHIIKANDTIFKISNQYHVPFKRIIEVNGLTKPDKLAIGQSIIIPDVEYYMVKNGDSIYKIAHNYDISYTELMDINPQVKDPYYLLPGQLIQVQEATRKDEIIVNGYAYPFLNIDILKEALPDLSYLSIFSYEVRPDGTLSTLNDYDYLSEAVTFGVSPRMVISNISEETGLFDRQLAHDILSNQTAVKTLIDSVLTIMKEKRYFGLDVDFENLDPNDKELFNDFIERVSKELHANNYTLSAAIEKKTSADVRLYEAHDYKVHGIFDDLVILMTYDWGYLYGPPMAISPANEVEKVLQYAITEIPSKKILMGIPNYAFDWTLPYSDGDKAAPLSHVDAIELAQQKNAVIQYDEVAQSPFFIYFDEDENEHIVWFEDARSIYAKLQLVLKYDLGGISYWTVNKSFPQSFTVIRSMFHIEKYIPL